MQDSLFDVLEQPSKEVSSTKYVEFHPERKLDDKTQMVRLASCAYIHEYHNIILLRASGAGKTYIACARLLEVGIAPRWQLFITKQCLDELDEFTKMIYDLDLFNRSEAIGQKFQVFIGGMSPEGNGYGLDEIRLTDDDLSRIPHELTSICREGIDMLGQPESIMLEALLHENVAPNMSANFPCVAVNADYDVYPNIAEPTEWWRLGNLKIDGINAIITAYRDGSVPGMKMNRKIPVSELAKRYGNKKSKKFIIRTILYAD